jgi:hypothetical protein
MLNVKSYMLKVIGYKLNVKNILDHCERSKAISPEFS